MGRIFTSVVLFLLLLQYVQSNSDEQTPDSPTQTPDIYPHQKYLIEQILTERQEGVTYINPTTQQPYPKTRYNSQEITTNHREQLETFIKHQKSPKNNDNQETEHITTFMEDRYMTAQLTEAITLCQSTNSRDKEKGLNILKNSVNNKKNPIALHQLALQYQLGIVVERNFKMAFELLSEAALFGYPPAQRELAFMYDTGKGTLRDSAKALVYYSIAEKGGDIESALVLGYKYATGNSVVKTCSQAAKYYRAVGEYVTKKITAQGYDNSGYFHFTDLKEYEETGDLLKHHEADIVEYMEFAADTGDPMYQIQVGLMYLYGVYDHEIDYNRAREYFELAHIQEIGRATALIGSLYEEGYGVPQSNKTALEYYQLAHDNGNVHGTYYLGRAYLRGTGVEKDYKLALQYLTEASNQMHIGATVELAKMYFEGNGVSYNYPQAAQLFNTAAVHDNAEAKYYFAKMNHHGLGVPERCTTAIHWYQAVANKGDWIYDFDEALEAYLNENYDTALILYEKLAAKGFKMAQFNAAWIFDNKLHSESYLQEMTAPVAAFEYYKLAAGQGNEHAHLRLGDFYYYGDEDGGIQVSYPLSISHYLTISKSNAQAMYNLGYIHQHGIGVISDRSVAHDFYSAALEADSNSVLACWLSLLSLGFDYVKEKYNNNAIHEVLPEFWEYMTYSSIFTEFLDQLEKDLKELEDELEKELQEMEKDKKLKQSSEYSFLDEDTDFGYKLDTILMALLCVTIAIVLLFRQGFIQVQVERR